MTPVVTAVGNVIRSNLLADARARRFVKVCAIYFCHGPLFGADLRGVAAMRRLKKRCCWGQQ
jgi:hypothetical protein